MTDFRALCAELVESVEVLLALRPVEARPLQTTEDRLSRARAALADEPAVPEGREPATWTEGVCGDGAALLKDGVMVPIEAVVRELNEGARARAALADEPAAGEPASVTGQFMPTDAELLCIAAEEIDGYGNGINPGDYEPSTEMAVEAYGSELCAYARAVLARWGNPAPQPVPVSERLPEAKDCDDQKRCWWLVHQSWPCLYLMKADSGLAAAVATHWLPAHALPLPGQEVEG